LEKGRDLFANEHEGQDNHPNHGAKIFSILPQNRSILATGDGGSPGPGHKRRDSLMVDGMPYQSLSGAVSGMRDTDVISIFSESGLPTGVLNRSRGVRPFSPTPGERVKDPLEDYKPSEELDIPKNNKAEEDRVEESASAKTVVQIIPEAVGRDCAIEDETAKSEQSESERSERRETERRWSVTDDGVVSD